MSTLPVTFTDSESLLMEDQQPSDQNRVLLPIEALAGTIYIMFNFVLFFGLCRLYLPLYNFPPLHPSLPELFSILSCTSAIILTGSVYSAARGERCWIKAWHVLFHMQFLAAACYVEYVVLVQGPLPNTRSADTYFVVGLGTILNVPIHIALYRLHTNMTRAAAREDDKCGLIILDIICGWIARRQIFMTLRKNYTAL